MKKGTLLFALVLLLLPFVWAGITLSEPLDLYSLGDYLYVSVDKIRGLNTGSLNIDLVCGNATINFVKIPARAFPTGEDQLYSVPYKVLDPSDLEITDKKSIVGNCKIVASIGSELVTSKSFYISDKVTVVAKLDKPIYNPGEGIIVTVDATKENGKPLDGYIQASNATTFTKKVSGGRVSESFSSSQTAEAGIYPLRIYAYDVGGDVLNEGYTDVFYEIRQVPSSLVLGFSDESATPGEKFSVKGEVFDQSGKAMEGSITLKLISPEGNEVDFGFAVGETFDLQFDFNDTAGIWKVYGSFGSLIEERELKVEELQKVEFSMEGSVLMVTNVGNVRYNKTITVEIGDENRELELNMGVGEVRKFNLKAPNGEYKLKVGDGSSEYTSDSVLLTGRAISISNAGSFKAYTLLWVILIAVLGTAGFLMIRKYKKTIVVGDKTSLIETAKVYGKNIKKKLGENDRIGNTLPFTNKSPESMNLDGHHLGEDKTLVDLTAKKAGSAQSVVDSQGQKLPSTIVAVHIKNSPLSEHTKKVLSDLIHESAHPSGLVDWRDAYAFIVFSPLITRTYANEVLAAKVASKIFEQLNAHNRKFREKIEFSIGIHSGELVASTNNGILKYTSIGNTISLAKRIAESDSTKILISDAARKKIVRDVKVNKVKDIGENPIYELEHIKNKEEDQAKLKDLLRRMEEPKE